MYLVSACLIGINCRYDGKNTCNKDLEKLMKEGKVIPVCPEVLGNMPIPRESCEIITDGNGIRKVISKSGIDYTSNFEEGARKTLEICKALNIEKAILQSRSPSCGYRKIYDGTFRSNFIEGNGITADLLSENGIEVYTELDWVRS